MADQEKLYIYIDESGTLGLKHNEPYFVVCALILLEKNKKEIKNSVRRLLRNLSFSELHATKMNFSQKQFSHNEFFNKNFSLSYLVSHKKSIHKNLFKKKAVCFNYFVFLTLEKILKDTHIKNIYITIDMRNIKVTSEKSLQDYLNIQLAQSGIYHKNVYVQYGDSKNFFHLQAVDLFSNSIYAKYNFGKNHFYSFISGKILHKSLFPLHHFTSA